jgi:hypothetical protein
MITKISVKGRMAISESIRGKRRPMTPSRVRSLLLAGRKLPKITPQNEAAVADAIERVRGNTDQPSSSNELA